MPRRRACLGVATFVAGLVVIACAGASPAAEARADGLETTSSPALAAGRDPDRDGGRRLYVTGVVGSSVGQPAAAGAVPLVAGQGACGIAVPRPVGDVRLELEARRRQPLSGATPAADTAAPAAEDWATTANVWRDLPLTRHLGLYVGGGGGMAVHRPTTAAPARSAPCWQVGGGVTCAATDRVTFDVGYRFSGIEAAGPRTAAPESELLFAVRIFDPFRGLRRDAGR